MAKGVTTLPENVDGTGGIFTIWCLDVCKAETLAVKRIRRVPRVGGGTRKPALIVAYNQCLRCRSQYEATLPVALIEATGGERRYRIRGLSAPAVMRSL